VNRASAIASWVATAGLEICWLGAWSAFTLAALVRGVYSGVELAVVFAAASALGVFCRRLRLRVVQEAALQMVGLGLFELWTYRSMQRAGVLAFCLWTALLWISGVLHARRSTGYASVCSRFDRGLAWLASLLIFELLLRGQRGLALDTAATSRWLLTFVVFGVLAIVLARNAQREMRLRTALASTLLLCAAGGIAVSLPDLRAPSVRANGVTAVLNPIGEKAVDVFFWIGRVFETSSAAVVSERQASWSSAAPRPSGARNVRLRSDDSSQLWAAVCITLAAAFGMWAARGWLFSRSARDARAGGWLDLLRAWLSGWTRSRSLREPIRAYWGLRRWGARSGLVARPAETPLEYGRRLKQRVPDAAGEIEVIVTEFCECAYAGAREGPSQARAALRRLRSPALLPQRIRSWLRGDID
jgi:Domain of unknown function (DUF4129)